MNRGYRLWVFFSVTLISLINTAQSEAQTLHDPGTLPNNLGDLEFSFSIGDEDAFGNILDVASVGEVLAVLDGMNSRISVFGEDGGLLGTSGHRGRGPREFFVPVALASSGERLFVLDRGNARIAELEYAHDSVRTVDSFRIPVVNPVDLCSQGNALFLLGAHRGFAIQVLDGQGQIVRSFGEPLEVDPTGGALTATGKIACAAESDLIAIAPETLGYLMVYTADGEIRWEGEIPGYVRQEYDTVGDVGMRPRRPGQGYVHTVASLDWVGKETVVVQLRRVPSPEGMPLMERKSLDLRRGVMTEAPSLPRSLLFHRSQTFLEEVAPYPIIKVYRER